MSTSWSEAEVRAIVKDYFAMLSLEMQGLPYKKSEHRNALRQSVQRPPGSIEYKHQNISAILLDLSMPFIPGYKPARNYQRKVLPDVVLEYLLEYPEIQQRMAVDVEAEAQVPSVEDILASLVDPPPPHEVTKHNRRVRTTKIDYLAREASNRSLGAAGEAFVINYEKARLLHAGRDNLAEQIEHVSATTGDHLGYDIRSYNVDGTDRFIEAKTTRYGAATPFFVTDNELAFSERCCDHYHLYRIFDFRRQPQFFKLSGFLGNTTKLTPQTFIARI